MNHDPALLATKGLHHITAIAVDPQENLDFYTEVLGLRLVKETVNFDSPDVYHFYYGDRGGSPGTILTFFPFTYSMQGRSGVGMAETVSFAVPKSAFDDWIVRLSDQGVDTLGPFERFGQPVLSFVDPDGMKLELVGVDKEGAEGRVIGFETVSLRVEAPDRTVSVLTEMFGYMQTNEAAERKRFSTGSGAIGQNIDIDCKPGSLGSRPGGGTIHHIAFRASDDRELGEFRAMAIKLGFNVTPIIDRQYFHSIYFREPGGVLFEVATDPPGFTVDETIETLGSSLMLPPRYEPMRADIERRLPPVFLPTVRGA